METVDQANKRRDESEAAEQPKQQSTMMEEPTYNEETETLTIHFKQGGTYTYPKFSPENFAAFHSAPSWGKWFHSNRPLFENAVSAKQVSEDEIAKAS